jgi:hypothetical protein
LLGHFWGLTSHLPCTSQRSVYLAWEQSKSKSINYRMVLNIKLVAWDWDRNCLVLGLGFYPWLLDILLLCLLLLMGERLRSVRVDFGVRVFDAGELYLKGFLYITDMSFVSQSETSVVH